MIIRSLIAMALSFYPRPWRKRYGDECAAMIEQISAAGWSTFWDVTKGAVAMQIKYNGADLLRTAVIFGAIGLALAGAGSFAVRDIYLSEVLVGGTGQKPDALPSSVKTMLTKPRLQAIIEKQRLYETQTPEKAIEMMQKNIAISGLDRSRINGAQAVRVVFTYPDAAVSERVTADLAEAIITEHGRLKLLDGPRLADGPIYPNRGVIACIGLLGGTLLGGLWTLVRVRPA